MTCACAWKNVAPEKFAWRTAARAINRSSLEGKIEHKLVHFLAETSATGPTEVRTNAEVFHTADFSTAINQLMAPLQWHPHMDNCFRPTRMSRLTSRVSSALSLPKIPLVHMNNHSVAY